MTQSCDLSFGLSVEAAKFANISREWLSSLELVVVPLAGSTRGRTKVRTGVAPSAARCAAGGGRILSSKSDFGKRGAPPQLPLARVSRATRP